MRSQVLESCIESIVKAVLREQAGALAATPAVARKKPGGQPTQPQKFDESQFKAVQGLGQKMRYLYSTLPQVGEGSSRNVFKLDDKWVIKMAKDDAGVAQNKAEATVCTVDTPLALFSKVAEVGEGYEWLKSELAVPMTEESFQKTTGIAWDAFVNAIKGAFPSKTKPNPPEYTQALQSLANNSWFKRLLNVIRGCKYMPGDLTKMDSWGVVNGRAAIIDSGFTEAVFQAHYVTPQQ